VTIVVTEPIAMEVVSAVEVTTVMTAAMTEAPVSTAAATAVSTTTTVATMRADRRVFAAPHDYTAAVPTIAPKNGHPLSLRPI
jgi:hypothetical protein